MANAPKTRSKQKDFTARTELSPASMSNHPQPQTSLKDAGPRRALGRGLAALIPASSSPSPTSGNNGLRMLPVERLKPNPSQPRKHFDEQGLSDLTHSLQVQGMLQPIIVRRAGDDYEIVAGERRWRAAQRAGLREVPSIVKDLSDAHALQIALIENIQRRDLDPIEEAEAYNRLLKDHKLTHEELAEAVGKNRVTITNSLRLLKMPPAILAMLAQGQLTAAHARLLMTLDSPNAMLAMAQDIVTRGASVKDTEARVKEMSRPRAHNKKQGRHALAKGGTKSAAAQSVETRLQRALGMKVRLMEHSEQTGCVEVHYHSLDALENFLDAVAGV